MRRRDFIKVIGVTAAWPLAARAQKVERVRRLGFLGAATSSVGSPWLFALVQRLGELGWVETRSLQIDVRWAEGRNDCAAEIAVEFARADVDLIVTYATGPALAAKRATATIPIVFAGGNATGLSSVNLDLVGKRVERLREIVPGLRRLAILGNVGVADSAFELREVLKTAESLGLETKAIKTEPQALFVVGDPLTFTNRAQIISWARGQRLPAMYSIREFVAAGGLMSYGPHFPSLFRRAAELSDQILRGAKPADIPVEQPTKFEFVINLKTAQSLGVTVPDKLLALTDEVIE
jgi:putative ABC transport system substrate-binding protein